MIQRLGLTITIIIYLTKIYNNNNVRFDLINTVRLIVLFAIIYLFLIIYPLQINSIGIWILFLFFIILFILFTIYFFIYSIFNLFNTKNKI